MESRRKFLELLDKYTFNTITAEEHDELFHLIASGQYDELLEEHFKSHQNDADIPAVEMNLQRAQVLMQKIISAEKHTSFILPRPVSKKSIARWSIAAGIAGVLITAGAYFIINSRHSAPGLSQSLFPSSGLAEKTNSSHESIKVSMEDGSMIILNAGSTIHYPTHFSHDKREVYLEGEAFFSVSKNPDRPFFVYNNNIVTHVLGTSFNVRSDKLKKLVEVSVVTGRVQVYENKNLPAPDKREKNNGVILTPNQKVVYREEEREFIPGIVNIPVPVTTDKTSSDTSVKNLVFEETPLREVIQALEKTYGLEIVVANDKLYNCLFTGDIRPMDLFSKLDVVCQSVKASYQVAGTKILIEGKGCN